MCRSFDTFVGRDYSDYFNQVRKGYSNIDNPFWYYEKLINELLTLKDIEILPMKEFVKKEYNGKKLIGLRHDIDADPITAVKCARALAREGLSGSFYFLHSAIYYGEFYDGIFIRNPMIQEWIKQIVIAGSEIGVHNDVLGVYKHHGYDGKKHFIEELNWMRGCGANIVGITSHNNFLTYGAENSEVFKSKELILNRNNAVMKKEDRFIYDVLGSLDLTSLGIEYDATFNKQKEIVDFNDIRSYLSENSIFTNELWAKKYFLNNPVNDWDVDYQAWLIGKNKWILSSQKYNIFEYEISLNELLRQIDNIQTDISILLELHPEYFGGK
ncbi:hypothetical protein Q6A86_09050 [Aliarcobacter skirrowii]|nr:hypothetical protein [Aliarcobacter skirrowii]